MLIAKTILLPVIAAVCVVHLLTPQGEVLYFYPKLVKKLTKNKFIWKVFFQCEKCLAGQLSLWIQVYLIASGQMVIGILSALYLFSAILLAWFLGWFVVWLMDV